MLPNFDCKARLKAGIRLSESDGLHLLTRTPLGELMRFAHTARQRRHPENIVTFVFDTNPNYTNVCTTRCHFCAFWRTAKARDAYTHTPEELAARVADSCRAGVTTVLLQGGHNPDIRLDDWVAYIRAIRKVSPEIHIHPFSPTEIAYLADIEGKQTYDILTTLWEEGIRTIPGGGAEVLSDRVRGLISPEKCSVKSWLSVMEEAHRIGFRTTATMMFGHEETAEEIVRHLLMLRELQDRTGGFSSFIPWSFKPGNTVLGEKENQAVNSIQYLKIISAARLLLDNFQHIQSSWFSENMQTGLLGLLAGADDFGGLLYEESVLGMAEHAPKASLEETLEAIRSMGFTPAQRDSKYEHLKTFDSVHGVRVHIVTNALQIYRADYSAAIASRTGSN